MTAPVASLLESFKALSPAEQDAVADGIELLRADIPILDDPDFHAELERRWEEHLKDPSNARKWSDIKAELLAMLPDE
jgi:predicted anti-sigma-YlaC factor YlaD